LVLRAGIGKELPQTGRREKVDPAEIHHHQRLARRGGRRKRDGDLVRAECVHTPRQRHVDDVGVQIGHGNLHVLSPFGTGARRARNSCAA
jgi:hypothetical protein